MSCSDRAHDFIESGSILDIDLPVVDRSSKLTDAIFCLKKLLRGLCETIYAVYCDSVSFAVLSRGISGR